MLSCDDLSCARGGVAVLEHVTFRVEPGEAVVLRGPNGSGKTTLLRTLAGLQPPMAGQVQVNPDTLAYAGHSDGIKATLTVAENLTFWAQVFGTNDITPALTTFDLLPLADRAAQNLSAGQKRRLGLGRLMVTGRALWLLDEPTVSLDAVSVAMFAAAVQAHCAGGGAAVMATHIDLGIDTARVQDLTPWRARADGRDDEHTFDEAFL